MVQLPNGCYCSEISVFPANWKQKGAKLDKDWYLQYYFHDPIVKEEGKYKYGKLCIVKGGINRFKTLEERRQAVQALLDTEWRMLKEEGYNPIRKIKMKQSDLSDGGKMLLVDALKLVTEKLHCEKHTLEDIQTTIKYFKEALTLCRLHELKVQEVERKHVRAALEAGQHVRKNWTNNIFNRYRSYMMIVFNRMVELEWMEENPVLGIKKLKKVKTIRATLSSKEREKVNQFLKQHHYNFWVFLQIFFHSGCRETELLRLKGADVDLKQQVFKVLVKKGKEFREVMKPIKNVALPYWREVMRRCKPGDYVFSDGLRPKAKDKPIRNEQIARRWRTHVKKKLGIQADFYSLKHLNTDETAALLGIEAAAAQNSHTTTVITMKHYAIGEKARQMERLKKVGNTFA